MTTKLMLKCEAWRERSRLLSKHGRQDAFPSSALSAQVPYQTLRNRKLGNFIILFFYISNHFLSLLCNSILPLIYLCFQAHLLHIQDYTFQALILSGSQSPYSIHEVHNIHPTSDSICSYPTSIHPSVLFS